MVLGDGLDAALEDTRLYKGNPVFQSIRQPSGLTYPVGGAPVTIPQDVRRERVKFELKSLDLM